MEGAVGSKADVGLAGGFGQVFFNSGGKLVQHTAPL